jgi:uncharacterized protein YecT (DUF1311 family)
MRVILAAALALLAPPAMAQDVVFDPATIDACFAGGGWEDCIGTGAGACMADTPGGDTTVGMVGCLDAELSYWDDLLNSAYAAAVADAEAFDSDRFDDNQPSRRDALRDMQRGWIAFRDATCSYEVLDMYGGTGANLLWVDCLMRMTGEQALYLESVLDAG